MTGFSASAAGEASAVVVEEGCIRRRVAYRLADWLSLAATPAFATMAVVTHLNGNPMDAHCSSGFVMPLRGMVPMYIAMSVFHLPPWLKLVFAGRPCDSWIPYVMAPRHDRC